MREQLVTISSDGSFKVHEMLSLLNVSQPYGWRACEHRTMQTRQLAIAQHYRQSCVKSSFLVEWLLSYEGSLYLRWSHRDVPWDWRPTGWAIRQQLLQICVAHSKLMAEFLSCSPGLICDHLHCPLRCISSLYRSLVSPNTWWVSSGAIFTQRL